MFGFLKDKLKGALSKLTKKVEEAPEEEVVVEKEVKVEPKRVEKKEAPKKRETPKAEKKQKKHKVVDLGPTVVLDSERCILCSRCVRFTDEVSKTNELGIFKLSIFNCSALYLAKASAFSSFVIFIFLWR